MTASPSQLPRCTPESQGVSSGAILRLLDAWEARSLELHGLMLLRHGHVFAEGWWEPYCAPIPHSLFSLTKSFTATAVGFALAEGRVTLDAPVLSFFPAQAPSHPCKHLQAMQLRHLLSMTTGHAADALQTVNSYNPHAFLDCPVEFAPGTHFVYNNGASHLLAVIVQKSTGQRLLDYLNPRLFHPLGIVGASWETTGDGFDYGARGLKLTTEAIARFGQLYLQQGIWNGMPLLLPWWVQQATSRQIACPDSSEKHWQQGYGFQFWCGRQSRYMAAGAYGQYGIVLPQHQMVIAITAGIQNTQLLLPLLQEHLLSALNDGSLPADPPAQAALEERLASLKLPRPAGAPTSPMAPSISGLPYLLTPNRLGYQRIRFDFSSNAFCRIHLVNERGEHLLAGRMDGQWQRIRTRLNAEEPQDIVVQNTWTSADTFVFCVRSLDTPYGTTFTCRFDRQLLRLQCQQNIGFPVAECTELLGWRIEL